MYECVYGVCHKHIEIIKNNLKTFAHNYHILGAFYLSNETILSY